MSRKNYFFFSNSRYYTKCYNLFSKKHTVGKYACYHVAQSSAKTVSTYYSIHQLKGL